MNELTLLRDVRSTIEGPAPESVIRGRNELLRRIAEENLASLGAPAPAARKPRRLKTRRLTFAGLGALTAGVLAVALVLTNILGLAGWRGSADSAAASVLHEAAVSTIQLSDPVVHPGQYLLVATAAVYGTTAPDENGDNVSYLTITNDQVWVPADRNAEWIWQRNPSKPYQFFGAESEKTARQNYDSSFGTVGNSSDLLSAPAGAFYGTTSVASPEALGKLPRDPYQLLNYIYRTTIGSGSGPDVAAISFIADTLRTGVVPANLRAALYEAAAKVPGVEITDQQATLDGRTGTAIGIVNQNNHTRQDIIIDPGTGQLIGEREILLEASPVDGYPAGTAFAWTAVTTSIVDTAPTGGTLLPEGCASTGANSMQCDPK
ncbi:hypothetical protein B7R22_14830 [Subtercola boreus]|uniref:Uncharacterized protein n=1 Tax=Subtercola boreus TaxID=120213 RepID=A0A3E0VTY8_9MICO|nr:CU044_5270 family protein [Subtercola boreus]RFA12823.1 hypothetical protein B7R22_14830 [Subtercola boreus]